jgi:peroxiredoxin (alkyl hydroperoxide reductase subunit C)
MGLVGGLAPKFQVDAVINGGETVQDFSLDQFLNKKYVILFFYPKDFTFVCPSELHAFQSKLHEFHKRDCEIIGCSTDTAETHWGWLQMPKSMGGIQGVKYPIIADTDKTISANYGVLSGNYELDEEENLFATGPMIAYRGLFLIDRQGIVQHQIVNNFPLGRNVEEALRMVDALNHFEEHGEVCPANWSKGKESMKESHEAVANYLANN